MVSSALVSVSHYLFTWLMTPLQPFMYHFPHSNIYELLAPDLLHQIIKGTFKDHLVAWVEQYLTKVHGTTCAQEIWMT
jgi:hypothetical protein